jgi:metallo-beta-lactamase family protein
MVKIKITALAAFLFLNFGNFAFGENFVVPFGAAETVSGSCFLIKTDNGNFIVDCGIFMDNDFESDNLSEAENKNLQIDKSLISAAALFLTHAHLDHSGKIPLLVHKGFKGKIYSTDATKTLVLSLFENGSGFELIKRKFFWSKKREAKSKQNNSFLTIHWSDFCRTKITGGLGFFDEELLLKDVKKHLSVNILLCKKCCKGETKKIGRLFSVLKYDEDFIFSNESAVTAINAGHIPGSASFLFNFKGKKILFSGDLGSGYSKLTGDFKTPPSADLVFMEATYSNKKKNLSFSQYADFRNDMEKAIKSKKIIWIPALSFNRTQKILYELKQMQKDKKLSKNIPIFSISPSANIITKIYENEIKNNGGEWFLKNIYDEGSILPENINFTDIKNYSYPSIIISSSGDMSFGKSAQIAKKLLSNKNVNIMIINYVSPNSIAGILLRNKRSFRDFKVNAKIKKYDIFSDHPDFMFIQKWLSKQDKNKSKICIIHSSKEASDSMKKFLKEEGFANIEKIKIGLEIKC